MILLIFFTTLNDFIWYGESDSAKKDTTTIYQTGIPLWDSLPIEENTPEVIKNLLTNPTHENAEKFLTWQASMMERAYRVSELLKETAINLGLEPKTSNIRYAEKKMKEQKLNKLKDHSFLVVVLSNNLPSQFLAKDLPIYYNKGFFIYAFVKDTIYHFPFPTRPYRGELKALTKRYPSMFLFDTNKRKFHVVAKAYRTPYSVMKRLTEIAAKEEK